MGRLLLRILKGMWLGFDESGFDFHQKLRQEKEAKRNLCMVNSFCLYGSWKSWKSVNSSNQVILKDTEKQPDSTRQVKSWHSPFILRRGTKEACDYILFYVELKTSVIWL